MFSIRCIATLRDVCDLLQVYTLERLAAGDLDGAAPLLAALAAALERLHKVG